MTGLRLFSLAIASAFLVACGEPEDTHPGQPVKQRQQAFKEIIRSFEPMGLMLKEKRYDAEKFAVMAEALAARREAPWSHFGPETDYPPSKSTAAVWSEAAKFEQAKLDFMAASDRLVSAAQKHDKAAVERSYQETYESCQACHKHFRQR